MNTLVIFSCVIIAAFAVPIHIEDPEYTLEQHSNPDGSYTFSYSNEDSSKTETRQSNGRITGAYSYIDTDGILQKVQYVGDDIYGFQVYGTNLPVGSTVPVKETPEVLEATALHFSLIDEHLKKLHLAAKIAEEYKAKHPDVQTPTIVDTPASKTIIHFDVPKPSGVKDIQRELPHIGVTTNEIASHKPVHVEASHQDIPVPPEEPEDIQLARAAHLAERERIVAEHLAAVQALS